MTNNIEKSTFLTIPEFWNFRIVYLFIIYLTNYYKFNLQSPCLSATNML